MDLTEIRETDIWTLYNKSVMYANKKGMYTQVDKNNNFYNGDQWEGLLVEGIEPVQLNFIKPIVNYKTTKITTNLRAINYSAENMEGEEFRLKCKQLCDLLNQRASRVWESDKLDTKIKKLVKMSAINGESIAYVTFDEEKNNPKVEILSLVDVYYGNENDSEIQNQPYIIIKQRKPISEVKKIAEFYGVSKKKLEYIIGDNDNVEEAGTDAKEEVDDKCTLLTKFYKEDGVIKFSKATKYVDIKLDADSGYSLYPIAHMNWEDRIGNARGEGEVRCLIPNQIEVNKTIMRRILTAKNTAYPQKIYNRDKIENPEAINTVGGVIEAHGMEVDDVNKVFATTRPAQMSSDVEKVQNELITTTRELASASETATGQINPEAASGRAILAVQQASEMPLNDQNISLNQFIEDIARIWLDMWKVYNSEKGIELENITTDPRTGEEVMKKEKVNGNVLEKLSAIVKVDVTPKGAFDKYAQEISLENLSKTEQFMNTSWLEDYVSLLDNDSVMPKIKLQELLKKRKEAQKRIQLIEAKGQMIQEQVQQLMNTGAIMPREMEQYMGQPTPEQMLP